MKRSEVIRIIEKHIPRPDGYNPFFDETDIAISILNDLEKIMDPPKRMLPLKYDNRGKQLQVEYTRTWEPE